MIRNNNYKKERFWGICLIALVMVIFLAKSIYLTYVLGESPTPILCSLTLIILSISRLLAATAAGLSACCFISYFDAIGTIYIGRGDKVYFQAAGGITTFLITFFVIFYNIELLEQC